MCNEKTVIIGLTGSTGSGKTTICAAFSDFGCGIIDCDKLSREATAQKHCINMLAAEFGHDILSSDGTIDRNKLALRAFSSHQKTQRLNDITHPVILESMNENINSMKNSFPAIIIDAPLLYEAGVEKICNAVIAVVAPFEVRLKRIMERDNITEEMALMRMSRQNDDNFYTSRADYILNGVSKDTKGDVKDILQKLQVKI